MSTVEAILLVLLGGLFGWMLGQLPKRYVYVVVGVAIILAVVVITGRNTT